MSRYISELLRTAVAQRAKFCCEYCGIHQDDLIFNYQVDHIVSLKHGGKTTMGNLAYACSLCNQNKGSDLGTYLPNSKRLIRLFNPRIEKWHKHFSTFNGEISAKTLIGSATIKLLDLNNIDRLILRQALSEIGAYPR